MARLFGTDGMRGLAGSFPLDAAGVRVTGRSLAQHLAERSTEGRAPRIVVGRDTRESGGWIEAALTIGATEAGARVESAGVITTPGVAYLARTLPADAGVVISASHNPYQDNGIKIFAPSGRKLDDATERLIEADINAEQKQRSAKDETAETLKSEADISESPAATLRARYLDYLAEEIAGGLRLDGLRLVLDCANGASSHLAP
ncbi:MAG TPA: hypothetical protein VEQ40_01895, partial [Pyrinomonadaceae bacterium]|nr:hypothetical protein [Pyrinomonadaceae bacterium]